MPTPLAHLAAGLGLNALLRPMLSLRSADRRKFLILVLAFSVLPDFDAIPGWIFGDMGKYHNSWSHSLVFGLAVCLLATPLLSLWIRNLSAMRCFLVPLSCYYLHIILDAFTHGRGVMLLWPFTEKRFQFPYPPFRGLKWSEGWWTSEHLYTLANELIVIGIATILIFGWFRLRQRLD
jgi:membrane-bound metal-dependent hydrolase YbcI (DUF457 family)